MAKAWVYPKCKRLGFTPKGCFDNEGYPASLEVGKLYRVIPDDDATVHGYIRVIDESGEDYAYTAKPLSPDATAYRC